MKVAICEDELSQAKIIRLYLSHLSEKYKITSVTYFADGETLFKAFESGIRFDLYLLDIDLPGMSGIDLGSVICSSQSNAAIFISRVTLNISHRHFVYRPPNTF